ncbi:hypothetical protein ABIA32_003838 [Streptacidiphilus sp. MAP12-20]
MVVLTHPMQNPAKTSSARRKADSPRIPAVNPSTTAQATPSPQL